MDTALHRQRNMAIWGVIYARLFQSFVVVWYKKNKNCIGSTELRVQPTSKVFLFAHSLLFVTFRMCVNVLRVGLTLTGVEL